MCKQVEKVEAYFPLRDGVLRFNSEDAVLIARGGERRLYRTRLGGYVMVDRSARCLIAHLMDGWEAVTFYWSLDQLEPFAGWGRPKHRPVQTIAAVTTWAEPRTEEIPGVGWAELIAESCPDDWPPIRLYRRGQTYIQVDGDHVEEVGSITASRWYCQLAIKYASPRRAGFRSREL